MKISIVIPLHNEEQNIPYLRERLEQVIEDLSQDHDVELILVDDGSTDETGLLLKKNFPNEVIYRLSENKGIGAATREGFKLASGDYICTLDADCSYAPEELIPMLNIISSKPEVDILIGSQYHPGGGIKDVPGWRLFFSRGASIVYRFLMPLKLYTYTGYLRIYKKTAAKNIDFKNNGFIAVTEILVRAIYLKFNIEEYPTTLSVRKFGASKIKTFKVIAEHLRFILGLINLKRDLMNV